MPRIKLSAPQRLSDERRQEINRSGVEEHSSVLLSSIGSWLNETPESRSAPAKKCKERRSSNVIADEILKEILSDCDFYLTLHKDLLLSDKERAYHLGNLTLLVHVEEENDHLPDCKECWLYVSQISGRSMLYFEWEDHDATISSDIEVPKVKYYLIDGLLDHSLYLAFHQMKTLSLIVESVSSAVEGIICVDIKVYLRLNPSDNKGFHPSDGNRAINKSVQKVAAHFLDIHPANEPYPLKREKGGLHKDIEDLYSAVKLSHVEVSKIKVEESVFHESLLPILRPYQTAAVQWMLRREKSEQNPANIEQELDPLYIKVKTLDSKDLYYNRYNGSFLGDWDFPAKKPLPTGGILADEMGLGKTVEVLACILSNPRKDLPPAEKLEPCEIIYENQDEDLGNTSEEIYEKDVIDCTEEKSIDEKNEEEIKFQVLLPEDRRNSIDMSNNISFEVEGNNVISHTEEIKEDILDGGTLIDIKEVMLDEKSSVKEAKVGNDEIQEKVKKVKLITKPVKKKRSPHKMKRKRIVEDLDPIMETIEEVIRRYCGKISKRGVKKTKAMKEKTPAKKISYTKQCCQDIYNSMIAEYSIKKVLYDKSKSHRNRDFFSTRVNRKSLFECACGMLEVEAGGIGNNAHLPAELQQVQCNSCGMWQHAHCVGYDLTNPLRGEYFCPHCWQERDAIPSGATLIVSPRSIAFQWIDEIRRHIRRKNLKVLYYERDCHEGFTQPRVLAHHDIVIVSYETLNKELNYVDLPHCNSEEGRRLRHAKRFMALPSPLPCVQWWRICLDEAQMVEMTSTKTAEMALRLSAVHRWCITGTPIQRSLNDLYGLVLFLGYHPYCVQRWWNYLLFHPYIFGDNKSLHEVLCKVMWRSCKKDVLDQIRIPPQREKVYWLRFCPTEEHFYRRQHVFCLRRALTALASFPDNNLKLESLDRITVSKILDPLLSLRQACCHPQAVKGKNKQFSQAPLPKISEWSMEHLLSSLVKKAKVEAEEALRKCVAALNGLAGVQILLGEWSLAEEKYRSILRLSEEYKQNLKVDTLQKIHTLHNLAEILDNGVSAGSATLREEAKELEAKYLNKCSLKIACAKNAVTPLTQSVESILQSEALNCKRPWWIQVIEWSCSAHLSDELVRKVKNDISDYMSGTGKGRSTSKINDISDANGLKYMLAVQIEDLDDKRYSVLSEMNNLTKIGTEPSESSRLVMVAVDCHLRQTSCSSSIVSVGTKRKSHSELGLGLGKEGNKRKSAQKKKKSSKCNLCEANANLERYEAYLFKVLRQRVEGESVLLGEDGQSERNEGEEDAQAVKVFGQLSRGNWADGEIERMLKVILGFAKSKKLDSKIIDHGNNQIKLMETMKKEYKFLRILWRQLNDQISAFDELNMAKLRLGLKDTDELREAKQMKRIMGHLSNNPQNKVESIHILGQHELEPYAARLSVELSGGSCELRKRMGQLFYLQNLEKANSGRHGGINPEPCPICHKVLGEKWSVLQCGHCYCTECIKVVVTDYSNRGGSVKCAVCRECTHHSEVSYVDTSGGPPGEVCDGDTDETNENQESEESSSKKVEKKMYEVKGSHSSKVEAVVRTLLSLVDKEPNVKALVFSTFPDILDIIAKALQENDIKFAHLKQGPNFQSTLNFFKDQDREVTALLLTVHYGAKGLNLIEATHVLLVDPILNIATELQAIGRVHRIGQTRPTVVHRFLVRDTIEERMYQVFHGEQRRSMDELSSDTPSAVTIGDLRLLFESVETTQENNPPANVVATSNTSVNNDITES